MKPRTSLRSLTAALLVAGLAAGASLGPVFASPTDAAFNTSNGVLNVNYAGYLSRHDIVTTSPTPMRCTG